MGVSIVRAAFALLALPLGIGLLAQTVRAGSGRVTVAPVFFIPTDAAASVSASELARRTAGLNAHLEMARRKYLSLLETDTFAVAASTLTVLGAKSTSYYDSQPEKEGSDAVHLIVSEIFKKTGDDRTGSRTVYFTFFLRPHFERPIQGRHQFGGGRTFNGPPGSGGGVVVVEFSSLTEDQPYPMQSTLVHELGHSFGLTHCNCFGYDLDTSNSLMSYNLRHHTKGLQPPPLSGTFHPEELYELSLNKLVFPFFEYRPAKHNPGGKDLGNVERCFLGPMSTAIGGYRRIPGKGYELFFDGKLVSGPEAAYYTRGQASSNCSANTKRHASDRVKVECRFDGTRFDGGGIR